MMRSTTLRRTVAMMVALLTGCAMGPDYERPESLVAPVTWRDSLQAAQDSSFANLPWWELFGDTTLNTLVREGLTRNQDLRVALARVNEARARAGIARLEQLPQIGISGTGGARQVSDSLQGLNQGQYGFFRVGATVSWELDLWGRLRRLSESAQAELLATEYGRRAAIVTIVSDVAVSYLELRALDTQAAIATRTVETQRQSVELAELRFTGGITSELDVRQGEAELARAESQLARLQREVVQKENELRVLIGQMPGDVVRGDALDVMDFPATVPPGLPATLLERRPDVREAEERLRSANARIGAAIAARFPTISLNGAAASVSEEMGDLFQSGTGFWNLAVNLFQPILDSGRNRQQVEIERARTEAAVAQYEASVLTAFREVEDALIGIQQYQLQLEAANRQAAAARRAVEIAQDRYQGGVDSYLTLLDAQRVLFDAELDESSLLRAQRVSMVQLYKALGGGWDPVTDSLAIPAPPEEN